MSKNQEWRNVATKENLSSFPEKPNQASSKISTESKGKPSHLMMCNEWTLWHYEMLRSCERLHEPNDVLTS
jgi:hypothetical protein